MASATPGDTTAEKVDDRDRYSLATVFLTGWCASHPNVRWRTDRDVRPMLLIGKPTVLSGNCNESIRRDSLQRSDPPMLSEGHDSARQRTHCVACNLRRLCLPGGLADQDTLAFETLVTVQRRIGRGTALVSAGEPFSSVYATRLGSFKAVLLSESGHEQITGFYMTGEMIGLDGIDTGVHQATIVAMEESEVCSIPFAALQRLAAINPHVQRQLHRALSRELGLYQGVMLLLGTMTAEQKMATFILSLSKRFALRGFSGAQFSFRMSRAEIGSFLGITVETVSRTLTRIQERGLINIRARELTILDLPNLRKSSGR